MPITDSNPSPATPQIVTSYWAKPIPERRWDWSAHVEGKEEGRIGYGATEAEAIADFRDQLEPAIPPANDVLFLETLLEQAQELRPEITVVRTEGCLFSDGYKAVAYRAEAPGGQLWMGDTVDELLSDIRENAVSEAA